jgi:thiol-disulfide isomerase/thioredoxin
MQPLVILAALTGFFVLACTAATTPDTDPPDGPEERLAPNFSFSLYQGEEILGSEIKQLSQLKGTPMVLNFWARLCPPCWAEMPELQEFSEEFQGQVGVLAIDIGAFTGFGPTQDPSPLLDSLGITYPTGFTNDGVVVKQYEILAMPTTVFINGRGEIFHKWTGALDRDIVTRLTQSMLAQGTD